MIFRITLFTSVVACCSLLGACSSKPYVDYDIQYDFTQATTYFIAPQKDDADPLMAPRVQSAIDSALQARGMHTAEQQQADLVIHYALQAESRPNNNRVSIGMGTGSYGSGGSVSVGGGVSRPVGGDSLVHNIVQIDMYPGTGDNLIWRGRDSFEVRGTPERRAQDIQRLVQQLLANFPPP